MSEDTHIEDVQEDTLVEETEQDTTSVTDTEVAAEESTQDSLSETVLKTLLGESQEEEEVIEEAKHDDDDEDKEEVDEAKHDDDDEEEVDEAKEDDDEDEEIDEEVEGDDEDEEDAPKTKAEILNQMYKEMKGMKKSQLHAAYGKLHAMYMQKSEEVAPEKAPIDGEEEGEEAAKVAKSSADAAKNKNKGDLLQAAYKMIKSQRKSTLQASYHKLKKEMASVKESMDESFDLESEVDLLVQADSNLSEEFKSKAQVVFEAAIANKVYDIKEQLEEQYNQDLQEELSHVRESLITKIDSYLTYVVEDWVDSNKDVVDSTLRAEITEGFITGLQGLFTEHYIDVPAEKRDLVAELDEKVKLIEGSLEQAESDKEDLEEKLEDLLRDKIIREHSEDLTSTQVEKLNSLLHGADFESEEVFAERVATVKETFFSESKEEKIEESTETSGDVEVVVEGVADEKKSVIPADMARYVAALGNLDKTSSFTKQ